MKRATLILLIFAMLVAPAACGLRDSPEGAAKEWLEALASFDGLKMDERTCSEQKEQLQQGGALLAAFSALGQEITDQNVRIDVSAVNLSTTKSTADTANVHVTGKIRASVGLLVQSQPVDEDWKMVKEGGKWAWCGEALASAVPVAPGSFEVQADQEWQDTGIRVRVGDEVSIGYLSGQWSIWPSSKGGVDPLTDGEGQQGRLAGKDAPLPDRNIGSLVGRIGSGPPFYVGNGTTMRSNETGNLMLSMNDIEGYFQDNGGSVVVSVVLRR